jgi:hypothetical protein
LIGTIGDSYDNAMAESVIGLFKTELHRNPTALRVNGGHCRGLDDLEIASCGGCRGSTTNVSTVSSTTSPRPKSKTSITVTTLSPTRHEKPKQMSLHQTQADSQWSSFGAPGSPRT